jgi:hypothetical protein
MAAKDLNILTIELQHGSPQRGKLNYDYSNRIKKQSFPDYFISFGDYWLKNISLPIKRKNMISFGYPYLSNQYSKFSDNEKSDCLVVISQPVHFEVLSDFALNLKELYSSKLNIIFKPHPADYKYNNSEKFNRLNDAKIRVSSKNDDLYFLLSKSKWVLGVFSTALYEAIYFRNFCFILNATGSSLMDDLITFGNSRIVNETRDIKLDLKYSNNDTKFLFNDSDLSKLPMCILS